MQLSQCCTSDDSLEVSGNRPYLIPLIEELRLPDFIRAKTNPKSSTGRLDIFTRVITDYSHLFDEIRDGYHGQLLSGGRPVDVHRYQQGVMSAPLQPPGDLSRRGGFSRALQAGE